MKNSDAPIELEGRRIVEINLHEQNGELEVIKAGMIEKLRGTYVLLVPGKDGHVQLSVPMGINEEQAQRIKEVLGWLKTQHPKLTASSY